VLVLSLEEIRQSRSESFFVFRRITTGVGVLVCWCVGVRQEAQLIMLNARCVFFL